MDPSPLSRFGPGNRAAPHSLAPQHRKRGEARRRRYLDAALPHVPRLLGAIDRNPYRPTYGCLDRQFWHYRTSDFPSEMYQEGALVLAQVYRYQLPGNRWQGEARVAELAAAAIRFAARSCHADSSCDDYYPYERALGAAVFSLAATTAAYDLLELDDPSVLRWFARRCDWLMQHDESGRLANHQALAGLGLARAARLIGSAKIERAAEQRMRVVLDWQSGEGWFEEYGGADPGYQTVTIDCLAQYRALTGATWLDEALTRAVAFSHSFLHPDGSYGGTYGSRGTGHFYPLGMELCATEIQQAAELADGFLDALRSGRIAYFDDDRLVAHRLGNLIEAYRAWRPRPSSARCQRASQQIVGYPEARIVVRQQRASQSIVSAARGGVFTHFCEGKRVANDAGLIVEDERGRLAVSQLHDRSRRYQCDIDDVLANGIASGDDDADDRLDRAMAAVEVSGRLHWIRFETATPTKFVTLRLAMLLVGRWCRDVVRRLLQRRLITRRQQAPISLTRRVEFLSAPLQTPASGSPTRQPSLRVIDTIQLHDQGTRVKRMSFGTDHEAAYVAATGVYQDAALLPWTSLDQHLDALHSTGRVTILREFE